jgi:hypothetical protein
MLFQQGAYPGKALVEMAPGLGILGLHGYKITVTAGNYDQCLSVIAGNFDQFLAAPAGFTISCSLR